MTYHIEQIATLLGAHRVGTADTPVDWLLIDSRSLTFPEQTLFFALRTQKNDGHRYLTELYARGVRAFVVSTLPEEPKADANYLIVPSPLKALQRLAERHREEFSIPIIGITGSNGKTIVKEWLYQMLSPDLSITRSPRSWNSQIGVPLSVWRLSETTQMGIFETGISEPGEMDPLEAIIQPTIGILTHIGSAHDENFASRREKCMEKMRLFRHAGVLIYNADDELIRQCASLSPFRGERIGWSYTDTEAPVHVSLTEGAAAAGSTQGLTTQLHITSAINGRNTAGTYTLPFIDQASIEDAIHCIATCLYLGLDAGTIAQRVSSLEPVAMRLDVMEGRDGCTLITDTTNSDLGSLQIALDFMRRRPDATSRRRMLILSDIQQTGLTLTELYEQVAELAQQHAVDDFVGIGHEVSAGMACAMHAEAGRYTYSCTLFETTADFLTSPLLASLHDRVVLIKGARAACFDRITEALVQRVHETTLEVNLSAVVSNYDHYRSLLKPHTRMICMVKASAYGAGAIEVARTLQDHGVDYLAVAVADEGAELRRAGITTGIIVMNPEHHAFRTLFAHRLEPEVYSFRLLDALIHAAEREGITNFPIHIKLDTGMHRLGFNPETDMPVLIARLKAQHGLIVRSVFTHLVGADDAAHDAFSARQWELFTAAATQLQAAFPHPILRHICNSAAIERFPAWHADMVRLGIGLYGVNPSADSQTRLTPISTLRTTILQLRDVPAGESIGYSRRTQLDRDSRIATLPIGYADGLNRHLGNRHGYCLVAGKQAPYVGNICMDVCMIDVTGIDCHEGDTAVVFGPGLPPSVIATAIGTIPYEVLTAVSPRVKRVYTVES